MTSSLPPDWRSLLAACRSTREIVAICSDRLDRVTPQEVALLPEACKPRPFASHDELGEYAVDLKRAACSSDPRTRAVAEALSIVFSDAMQRIAQITGGHRAQAANATSQGR